MLRPIAVIALLAGSHAAHAAPPWNAFQAAFPLLPCQDGWAACLVAEAAVTPDLAHDGTGAVAPADLRIGWFDLHATAAFSPFATLSVYPAAPAASADAEPTPAPAPAPTQASRDAEEATRASEEASAAKARADAEARDAQAARAQADADAKRAAQERAEARAKTEAEAARKAREAATNASAAEKARLEADARAAEAAQAKSQAEAKKKAEEQARMDAEKKARDEAARLAAAEATKRAAEEESRRKAEEEAKKKAADEAARVAAEAAAKKAADEAAAAKVAAATPDGDGAAMVEPTAAVASGDCTNTLELEPMAMLGKLGEGTVGCLSARLQSDAKMTDKDKVSRVLMANLWAKGDKKGWEKQAKYHLEEIDQSDPDLCYKYALRLSTSGVSRAEGAIHWADVALENRTQWTGDEYVSKVYGLYKMKAVAGQEMWKAAQAAHVAAPTDDTKKKMDDTRNRTKVYAREWYEYAKASGKDKVPPQQLCMSAAGTADYCEGG